MQIFLTKDICYIVLICKDLKNKENQTENHMRLFYICFVNYPSATSVKTDNQTDRITIKLK